MWTACQPRPQTQDAAPPGAGATGDSPACRLSGDAGHRGANMGPQVLLHNIQATLDLIGIRRQTISDLMLHWVGYWVFSGNVGYTDSPDNPKREQRSLNTAKCQSDNSSFGV